MSITRLFSDILPQVKKLISSDIRQPDEQISARAQLDIRADLANDFLSAPNGMSHVTGQDAYDTSSVLDRQLTVLQLRRSDYQKAGKTELERTDRLYRQQKANGIYLNSQAQFQRFNPTNVDEPYLDSSGKIVYDTQSTDQSDGTD